MKHIKGLDTLRAFAVILVIHNHWGFYTVKSSAILTFILTYVLPSGGFAVDFFFVLSGFLITNILLNARNLTEDNKFKTLLNFFVRRCLRIFPVYYILIILLFALDYPDIRKNFSYLITYTENILVFKQGGWDNFSHTWSLAVEEQFYLLWPIIILFVPAKFTFKVVLSFVIIGTLLNYFTIAKYGVISGVLLFNCFNAFAIGAICSFTLLNDTLDKKINRSFNFFLPFAIILYTYIKSGGAVYFERIADAVIAANIVLYVVKNQMNIIAKTILNNNILVYIGKLSYGIYLYHYCIPYYYENILEFIKHKYSIQKQVIDILKQPLLGLIFKFALVILISSISYYLIERRFLNLKKYFIYRKKVSISP